MSTREWCRQPRLSHVRRVHRHRDARPACGALTRGQLRWKYTPLFPGVYARRRAAPSLWRDTVSARLWSGRSGVIAGRAAAALHGALWVDAVTPIEMIWRSGREPSGIIVRNERIYADGIVYVDRIPVTSPARTALDLARHLPRDVAVRHLDALARAPEIKACYALSLVERYRRARGLRRYEVALDPMDPGASVTEGNVVAAPPHRRRTARAANPDTGDRRRQAGIHRYEIRRTAGWPRP